jgi:hypothetical protein
MREPTDEQRNSLFDLVDTFNEDLEDKFKFEVHEIGNSFVIMDHSGYPFVTGSVEECIIYMNKMIGG